jgi:ABC-2 type transport system ATP-binding protein
VLLSTHILPEVESTCGRVLIIHRGRLVGEGEPGRLRGAGEGSQTLTVEARADRARLEQVLKGVEGVRRIAETTVLSPEPQVLRVKIEADAGDVAERVFAAVAAAGLTLRELRRDQTSLEDVFAKLTTHDAASERDEGGPSAQAADRATAEAGQ